MRQPRTVFAETARSIAASFAPGATTMNAATTVTGELISVWCYIQSAQNVGQAGYLCAWADLKWEGNPAGILAADGKVYQLTGPGVGENNANVLPHLGKNVTATGDVSEKEGVRLMIVSDRKPAR